MAVEGPKIYGEAGESHPTGIFEPGSQSTSESGYCILTIPISDEAYLIGYF